MILAIPFPIKPFISRKYGIQIPAQIVCKNIAFLVHCIIIEKIIYIYFVVYVYNIMI